MMLNKMDKTAQHLVLQSQAADLVQAATLAIAHQDEEPQAAAAKAKLKIPLNKQEQHLLYQGKGSQAATDQPAVAAGVAVVADLVVTHQELQAATAATEFLVQSPA
jgi:hypothetical protein